MGSAIFNTVNAQSVSVLSFHGVGITVELTYPKEAHPEDNIQYNLTITSQIDLEINNFTLTIYGSINHTFQEIKSLPLILPLYVNVPFMKQVNVSIPKGTFGRLYCTLYAKTDQDVDYLSTSFYSTHVNQITFTELLTEYDLLLSNYNNRLSLYDSLLDDFNDLMDQKDYWETEFTEKAIDYNTLQIQFQSINETLNPLQTNYTTLKSDFSELNQTNISLQNVIDSLQRDYDISLDTLATDRNLMIIFIIILVSLIGLIIYLRNKQKEPYVVIRKETVSMKPEKK